MASGLAVGIDLGTTTSLTSIGMPDGMPRLLRDPRGQGIIPSVVSILPDGHILVGQRAKDRIVLDPDHTFFSTKRFIGRDMRREENSWAAAAYPYRILAGDNGNAIVRAHGRTYTLVDIAAMILAYLKKLAEQATGLPVPGAVITVPANFNDVQRETTRQAGERAGFEVLRILNEPTAAALAYGLQRSRDNERIAVYDFGGGTFDMTILEVRGDVYEVLATAGNTLLGGDDFDRRIFDRMVGAFEEQTGHHPRKNQEFHQKLFLAAERMKCQLSDWLVAGFSERGVEIAGSTVDFQFELSREQFNEACGDLVDMSFDVCDEVLRLAGCTLTSIDQIILVGGTTRVPLLRERVTKYFLRPPLDNIQPDTVVSLGAAIQSFALAGGPAMWPAPDRMPMMQPADMRVAEDPTRAIPGGVAPAIPVVDLEGPTRIASRSEVPGAAPVDSDGPTRVASRAEALGVAAMRSEEPTRSMPPGDAAPAAAVRSSEGPTRIAPLDLATAAAAVPVAAADVEPIEEEMDQGLAAAEALLADEAALAGRESAPEPPAEMQAEDLVPIEDLPAVAPQPAAAAPAAFAPLPPLSQPPFAATPLPPLSPPPRPSAPPPPPAPPPQPQPPWVVPTTAPPPAPDALRLTLEPPVGFGQPAGLAGAAPASAPSAEDARVAAAMAAAPPLTQEAMASILAGTAAAPRAAPVLLDVTPMTLGIQTVGGNVEPIIRRNSQVPVEQSRMFATTADGQTTVTIRVCQGESRKVEENVVLGEMSLEDLPPLARGHVAVRVTFEINTDGILSATAVDTRTNRAQRVRITLFGGS